MIATQSNSPSGLLQIALAHGLILALMVTALMRISGHFNPAVTMALFSLAAVVRLIRAAMIEALTSGYVQRALEHLPKQGSKEPWKLRQNYPVDLRNLRHGSLEDGAMRFVPAARGAGARQAAAV